MKIYGLVLALFFTISLSAQNLPFHYQAVARDADGTPLTDQNIGIRFSILQGAESGSILYAETHAVVTSDLGMVELNIGTGNALNGTFDDITWDAGPYYLKVDMDVSGLNIYEHISTLQFLAVPIALYALSSGSSGAIPMHEWQGTSIRFEQSPGVYGDFTDLKGEQGEQGETGPQGEQGETGAAGPKGDPGETGPQGPQGEVGAGVVIVGSVVTAADLASDYQGNIGDLFISQDDGHGHVWDGTVFNDVGSIKGPRGDQGPKGDEGPAGVPGNEGPQGDAGPKGDMGETGPKGDPGEAGLRYVAGTGIEIDSHMISTSALELWSPVLTLSVPPQLVGMVAQASVETNALTSTDFSATKANIADDLWVGARDGEGIATHIQPDNIHFDGGTGKSLEITNDLVSWGNESMHLSEAGLGFRSIDGGGLPIFESLINEQGFSISNPNTSFQTGRLTHDFNGHGFFELMSDRGAVGHQMGFVAGNNAAYQVLFGNNGQANVTVGPSSGSNLGSVRVFDQNGLARAEMYIDNDGKGVVLVDDIRLRTRNTSRSTADTQSMGILHGPEVASYLRGTATLVDGETIVTLPNSFT
nr:collagen-like protein [Saprospiraceae bacterium]